MSPIRLHAAQEPQRTLTWHLFQGRGPPIRVRVRVRVRVGVRVKVKVRVKVRFRRASMLSLFAESIPLLKAAKTLILS